MGGHVLPDWGAASPAQVTLERLLSVVGAGALELHMAPAGLAGAVTGVTVLDPLDPGIRPGELLLAVGVDARSAHAVDVLRRAGEGNAAGVVFGPGGPGPAGSGLRTAATEAGTAVLFRTAWCTWEQLVGVVRAGLASAGVPPGPTAQAVALGDLERLAEAVAALTGGSVTIEDPESRVLAYSSTEQDVDEQRRLTILGRRVPPSRVAAMREAGFFRALWGADDVLYRPAKGDDPERLVAAVRAGGEVLGSIWVAAVAGRPLAPDASEALRTAARAAAPHLLRHRTRGVDTRLVEDAARAVLEGRGSPEVLAERASLPVRDACAVLAVHHGSRGGDDALRLPGLLALHCSAHGHEAVVVPVRDRALVVLGPLDQDPQRAGARLAELGAALAKRLSVTLRATVRVGLGDVVPGLARLPESRRSAELALDALLAAGGSRAVASTEDVVETVGMLQVLDALREVTLPPRTPVARLAAFDAEHSGSCLVQTLRAYLDHFGDVPAASRALGVHPNSLRYRLRRITALSGIDLDDPDARLLAQIQLRLRDRENGEGTPCPTQP
ncbi:helix-turn-helix domain-containing protein [Streptomyces sp. S.PNR 29]|uniref:PucR family transcriptional regulator n=1 Tax=Streptomyces sp. S.PNR 29 TaxID=2973805 RepID=UPI0025B1DEFE|nr:helix-turn-helix domain-containing protein [Streptomyces sp. S.PNR 29]MDN0198258.1 helix-turn-helix domain-containing protein [Streptomyces sp. S.PNR 29]